MSSGADGLGEKCRSILGTEGVARQPSLGDFDEEAKEKGGEACRQKDRSKGGKEGRQEIGSEGEDGGVSEGRIRQEVRSESPEIGKESRKEDGEQGDEAGAAVGEESACCTSASCDTGGIGRAEEAASKEASAGRYAGAGSRSLTGDDAGAATGNAGERSAIELISAVLSDPGLGSGGLRNFDDVLDRKMPQAAGPGIWRQFALFEEVVRQWSVSSKLAYGEFPVPPYAGR